MLDKEVETVGDNATGVEMAVINTDRGVVEGLG